VTAEPAPGSVGAVVVNYNAAGHLGACLDSLAANDVETILVVDNASADASLAEARTREVPWIETGTNLGYGRAVNQGANEPAVRASPYLLVCNPDLVIRPGAVTCLLAALEDDPSLAVVGPRLSNPDGSLYPSARTFPDLVDAIGHGLLGMVAPRNRFTRRYRLLDWDHRSRARVDWVSGACFLIRRDVWDTVDGFDPSYFMYMEDVDLCWRVSRAGWAVGYEPGAEVVHAQGVSADRHPYRMLAAHHRSMWRFAWRTTTGGRRAALPIVGVGLAGRLLVAMAEHRFSRSGPDAGGPGSTGGWSPRPLP
jgi:N-acetylglucosaminyl-diphospho-decaprenol L-rhamnosyltransferase